MSKQSLVKFRVTDTEKFNIKINASSLNMKISSYLRFLSLLQIYLSKDEQHELIKTSRLLLDTETYKQFLFQLRAIGNNLNQATKTLNTLRLMQNVRIEDCHFEDIETSIKDTKELLQQTQTQIKNLESKTIIIK